MAVYECLTEAELDGFLTRVPKTKLVAVDFYATWCQPCTNFAPIFEELSRSYADVLFLKINGENCPQVVDRLKVDCYPTFIFMRDTRELKRLGLFSTRIKGADKALLEHKIIKYR